MGDNRNGIASRVWKGRYEGPFLAFFLFERTLFVLRKILDWMVDMKRRWIIGIVLIVAILLLRVSVVAMQTQTDNLRFAERVKAYEAEYKSHARRIENSPVLLCFESESGQDGFLVAMEGYHDWILLEVEIDQASVTKVILLEANETDGYGSYVEEDWFLSRLLVPYESGVKLVKYRKEAENEVVAITGATITSQSVVDAVNACIQIKEEKEDE